jgi:hypothetical protein
MKRVFDKCPRCGSDLIPTEAFSGVPSEFWLECSSCNTFVNTYIPQEHQDAVHKDPHTFLGNFGAYGTGKTLTSREQLMKHLFITENANALVGANIVPQYEQTIKRELEGDLPKAFVADSSVQKAFIELKNGARVLFRPFDDPDKLRSLNLSFFVMVEASEIDRDVFDQLKTRLRNTAATTQKYDDKGDPVFEIDKYGREFPVYDADWRQGVIESNPDSGWIRTEILLVSDKIHKHGEVRDEYHQDPLKIDPDTATHVASTDVNKFLPPNFIENISRNKPAWWVSRYVWSSFAYSEGLVYPEAVKHIVRTFDIPQEWKRMAAHDYGLQDPSRFLFIAIDEDNELVYVYREISREDTDITALSQAFLEGAADVPVGGWLCPPIIDPMSGARRDYHKKSLIDLYMEEGIAFEQGYVNIEARIFRLATYFKAGRVKIMDCCQHLIEELREYKFQPRTLENKFKTDKPIDKNNHSINCLEWMCMKLPANPANLMYGVYNQLGQDVAEKKGGRANGKDWLPHALQDSGRPSYDADSAYGIGPVSSIF